MQLSLRRSRCADASLTCQKAATWETHTQKQMSSWELSRRNDLIGAGVDQVQIRQQRYFVGLHRRPVTLLDEQTRERHMSS